MLARDLYTACVEKDPDFAPAWARLGRCHRFLQKFGPDPTPDYRQAQQALERAFALNPNLILAHSLYTPIQADIGQAENAMTRLLQKLAVHENAAELFAALVHACRYCGQLDASVAAHNKARQLDPTLRTSVSHTYFALGDYERSLFWYGTATGYYLDALLLACTGREQEALALLCTRKSKFDLMPAGLRSLHAFLEGDRERGLAVLRASRKDARNDPEMIFYLARQASRLGDLDLANEYLSRSVEVGYWSVETLLHDPWLDPLRCTVEFNRTFDLAKQREEQSRTAFLKAGGEEILL